jgi:DNA-binding PadR family transcriptional regulator
MAAFTSPTDRFLPLSPQVFQVLLSLHDEPRHGYAIIQDIRLRTAEEMRLTASTLYDALARLAEQGLIATSEAPDDETDARRRYYRITDLGRAVTAAEARRLQRLIDSARAKRVIGEPRR